jgi:E3 ubiquitin-protein ligase MGRN1
MNQQFPPSTEDGIPYVTEVHHVIDLSLHTEAELCKSSNTTITPTAANTARESTYPLIIRLESITEEGRKAGHTLEELKPGGDQTSWIQSQTTFAELHKEDEHNGTTNSSSSSSYNNEGDRYVARILKQKIWVQGTSYELQEIYGLQQGPRNSKTSSSVKTNPNGTTTGTSGGISANEDEERLCVICLVNDRDTTVLPCRHMCMCHECAQELRKQTSKCPICRKEVESLLHIKLNRSGAGGSSNNNNNNNNNNSSSRRAAAAAAT